MVVEYASGAHGSCWSFFTVTPRVLFKCWGSAIPLVFPQLLCCVAISILALYLESIGANPFNGMAPPVSLGILVSFLLVFKTQNSYSQFWTGLAALESLLQNSRIMAMTACTLFDLDTPGVDLRTRRIVRLLAVHFFVIVEYFQRTGANAISDRDVQDALREDIKRLTGPREFEAMYPGEERRTAGSWPHGGTKER